MRRSLSYLGDAPSVPPAATPVPVPAAPAPTAQQTGGGGSALLVGGIFLLVIGGAIYMSIANTVRDVRRISESASDLAYLASNPRRRRRRSR